MKNAVALLALVLCCSAIASDSPIPAGSAIYVDPQNGLDRFMAEAFQSQHLALRVVASPAEADFTMDSVVMPVWDVVRKNGKRKSAAAVKLTSKSGEVVWRHTVSPSVLKRGDKSTAEDCAKNLKSSVSKSAKP